ncbi:MAG: lipopolysaccharide heptosyltransferase II [Lentisphaerae bacterium GWF2_52_8]|nr:MAG: lipopolysaccharide heptosyltransferase II [Lentisphaerae bacterium GWF2_52_8]
MKVLFIKPSSLGDVLHSFPSLALLRQNQPEAIVDWLIHPAFAPLLKYQGIRRAIPFDRKALGNPLSFIPSFLGLWHELREEDYDLVLDLQGLFRSAFFARAARSKRVAGFASPRESMAKLFYRESYQVEAKYEHAVERNLALTAAALKIPFSIPEITMAPVEEYAKNVAILLQRHGVGNESACIGIAPGARWDSKRWPPDFFASVIDELSGISPEPCFLLLGAPSDRPLAEAIRQKVRKAKVFSLAGETGTGELVELTRRCSLLITNDSGPMHVAAALKTPLLALFGPTAPDRTGPFGDGKQSVFAPESLRCAPCLKKSCPQGTLLCQRAFIPSDIAEAARGLMFLKNG